MLGSHTVQVIGTIGIAFFGAILLYISSSSMRFSRYGREALACAGAYALSVAVIRMMPVYGLVSHVEAREINGIVVFIYLAILTQVWLLHRREVRS